MSGRLGISIEVMLDIVGGVLEAGASALEEAGIPYWLSAGTALGLYREGNFIAGDTDIDVGINGDISAERVEEAMLKAGFMANRFRNSDGKSRQRAFVKDGIPFDVFFYSLDGDYYTSPMPGGGLIEKPKQLLKDLSVIKFNGREYPIPKCPEYLRWRYGDWEIPSDSKGIYVNP